MVGRQYALMREMLRPHVAMDRVSGNRPTLDLLDLIESSAHDHFCYNQPELFNKEGQFVHTDRVG